MTIMKSLFGSAKTLGGRASTLAALVALCLAVPMANAADSLTMADFGHKIKLQVDGYTGTETLVNFPVLVRISESGIPGFHFADMSAWNNAHTQTYGHDLAFFAEDGTRLACEKDTWVHNGESLVWVKLPTMTRDTKFYMCYNVEEGVYVTNDNPWGGYVGVWHLSESGVNKTIADASPNGMDGYTTVGEGVNANNGRIGRARVIANNNDHAYGIVVDATNGVKKALAESLGTDFHASFWMSVPSTESKWKWSNLIGRRKGDNGTSWGFAFGKRFALGVWTSDSGVRFGGLGVVVVDASVVAPDAVGSAPVAAFVVAARSLGLASCEQKSGGE